MAAVTDVVLKLGDRANKDGRWSLGVSYSIAFEAWERGAWFHEEVAIEDLGLDERASLATLTGPPFSATDDKTTSGAFTVARQAPTFLLPSRAHGDRIVATVDVIPLKPSPGSARSPQVPPKSGPRS